MHFCELCVVSLEHSIVLPLLTQQYFSRIFLLTILTAQGEVMGIHNYVITGNTTLCTVSIFVTVFSLFVTGCCFVSSLARFLPVGMGGF